MTNSDEQGALLTPSQRAYLTGDSEVEPESNNARAVESRIRTRLRWGMYDFILLLGHLSPEERAKVFAEKGGNENEEGLLGTNPIRNTIIDALGFFYLATSDLDGFWAQRDRWREMNKHDAAAEKFAAFIQAGITRAFTIEGENVENVDVNINIEPGESLSDLADGSLDELPENTLHQMLDAEEITPREYGEAMQGRPRE